MFTRLVLAAVLLTGCSEPPPTPTTQQVTVQKPVVPKNPVAEFEVVVEEFKAGLQLRDVPVEKVTYDVQQTDSLVSPYVGYILVETPHPIYDGQRFMRTRWNFTYGYQNGAWVLTASDPGL